MNPGLAEFCQKSWAPLVQLTFRQTSAEMMNSELKEYPSMDHFGSCNLAPTTYPGGSNDGVTIPLAAYPSRSIAYPAQPGWPGLLQGNSFKVPDDGFYEFFIRFIYVRKDWQIPDSIGIQMGVKLSQQNNIHQPILHIAHPVAVSGTACSCGMAELSADTVLEVTAQIENGDWHAGWSITGGDFVFKQLR